jgi:hypothetical protein
MRFDRPGSQYNLRTSKVADDVKKSYQDNMSIQLGQKNNLVSQLNEFNQSLSTNLLSKESLFQHHNFLTHSANQFLNNAF